MRTARVVFATLALYGGSPLVEPAVYAQEGGLRDQVLAAGSAVIDCLTNFPNPLAIAGCFVSKGIDSHLDDRRLQELERRVVTEAERAAVRVMREVPPPDRLTRREAQELAERIYQTQIAVLDDAIARRDGDIAELKQRLAELQTDHHRLRQELATTQEALQSRKGRGSGVDTWLIAGVAGAAAGVAVALGDDVAGQAGAPSSEIPTGSPSPSASAAPSGPGPSPTPRPSPAPTPLPVSSPARQLLLNSGFSSFRQGQSRVFDLQVPSRGLLEVRVTWTRESSDLFVSVANGGCPAFTFPPTCPAPLVGSYLEGGGRITVLLGLRGMPPVEPGQYRIFVVFGCHLNLSSCSPGDESGAGTIQVEFLAL
jgi:hypothetical protein